MQILFRARKIAEFDVGASISLEQLRANVRNEQRGTARIRCSFHAGPRLSPGYRNPARLLDIPNPAFLVPWPAAPSVPFARARGIFGRPVSDYLPGTDDLDTSPLATAKCHGGIKHCLPIGAARTRTRTRTRSLYLEPRDIQCRTAIVIYAPPRWPSRALSRSLGVCRPFQRDRRVRLRETNSRVP